MGLTGRLAEEEGEQRNSVRAQDKVQGSLSFPSLESVELDHDPNTDMTTTVDTEWPPRFHLFIHISPIYRWVRHRVWKRDSHRSLLPSHRPTHGRL